MSAAPPATTVAPTTAAPATPPAPVVTAPVKPAEQVTDQQTGKVFKKLPEQWYDIASAWFSAIYSLAVIGYLAFLVLYMRSGNNSIWPEAATTQVANLLKGPLSRVILYTAIGGAMGAAVNNLRSFIAWHAEEKAFGWRFIWKYVAMPPLGGTLAVLVYGILQGGMAVINGGSNPNPDNPLTSLSAWATGTLAGYGSSKVFIWLDDKVNTLFKIDKKQVAVPDVKGKSLAEAKQLLSSAQLTVGKVSEQATTSSDQVGKVIAQTPEAGTQLDCGSSLDLTVGIASSEPIVDPTITAGSQGGPQNGNGHSSNGKPDTVTETATTTNVATGTETTGNGTGKVETTSGTDTNTTSETSATETTASETTSTETAATETATSDTDANETTATEPEEQPSNQ